MAKKFLDNAYPKLLIVFACDCYSFFFVCTCDFMSTEIPQKRCHNDALSEPRYYLHSA